MFYWVVMIWGTCTQLLNTTMDETKFKWKFTKYKFLQVLMKLFQDNGKIEITVNDAYAL